MLYTYDNVDYVQTIATNYDISSEADGYHYYDFQINIPELILDNTEAHPIIVVSETGSTTNFAESEIFYVYQNSDNFYNITINGSNHWENNLNWIYNNKTYEIIWESYGVDKYKIEFSKDNEATWELLADNLVANQGTNNFEWNVAADKFMDFYRSSYIRISSLDNGSTAINLSNQITLAPVPAIQFIAPLANEVWTYGTTEQVSVKNNYDLPITINWAQIFSHQQSTELGVTGNVNSLETATYDVTVGAINNDISLIKMSYNLDGSSYEANSDFISVVGAPQINLIGEEFYNFGNIIYEQQSQTFTFVVNGTNLESEIYLDFDDGGYYLLSLDNINFYEYLTIPQVNGIVENTVVYVIYNSNETGENDDEMYIYSDNSNDYEIELHGTCYEQGEEVIISDKYEIDFGKILIGESKVKTINISAENVNQDYVYVDFDNWEYNYMISLDNINYYFYLDIPVVNGTLNETLLYVKYTPYSTDIETDYLEIDGDENTIYVYFTGEGIDEEMPVINVDAKLNTFGNLLVNQTSTSQMFNVWGNYLESDIDIIAPEGFYLSFDNINFFNDLTLENNLGTVEETTIYVNFAPTALGVYAGNIEVTNNDMENYNISVSGICGEPSLYVTPSQNYVNSLAGQTTFSVYANVEWIAEENADWVTISDNGNNQLLVTYDANSDVERIADITVTGTNLAPVTYTLTQSAFEPMLYTNTGDKYFNSLAHQSEIQVISNVDWTATSDETWCTVTPSGNGSGIMNITIEDNLDDDYRYCYINLYYNGDYYDEIYIEQEGYEQILTLSSIYENVDFNEGSVYVDVNSNTEWVATSSDEWCSVSIIAKNTSLVASFTTNYGPERMAYIYVISEFDTKILTIKQNAFEPELEIAQEYQYVTDFAGSVDFDVTSNAYWFPSTNADWVTVNTSGFENGTITANFEANLGAERTATIYVNTDGIEKMVYLVQDAFSNPDFTFNLDNQNVNQNAGSVSFDVNSTIDWTVSSDADWCDVSISRGDGTIVANYEANATTSIRTAKITVTGVYPYHLLTDVVTVTQDAFVSINENANLNVKIYPNPTNGIFNIYLNNSTENTNVAIYNVVGNKVVEYNNVTENNLKINIKDFSNGVYFIKINSNNNEIISKIIKN